MQQITIIGGGITGLTLAWLLARQQMSTVQITLCESNHRLGGWIQSDQQTGFLFEQGPRTLRTQGSGRYTLQLIESLGLENELISPPLHANKRYLFSKGSLKQLPSSLGSICSWSPLLLKGLWRDLTAKIAVDEEESVASFVTRRLGRDALEYLFDPLVAGIYAGDPNQLSMQATFPRLLEWEKRGSLIQGMWTSRGDPNQLPTSPLIERWQKVPLWSLTRGLESLPQRLEQVLKEYGVVIKLNTPVVKVSPEQQKIKVVTALGEHWSSERVYVALSSASLSNLVDDSLKTIVQPLCMLPSASIAVVNLGFQHQLLRYKGFGHLIPSVEQEEILGMIWDSSLFPQHNRLPKETRLTVLMGGMRNPNVVNYALHELEGIARQALSRQLGIKTAPDAISIKIARSAIPQPIIGSSAVLKEVKAQLAKVAPNLIPIGLGWNGVSLNDCVSAAYRECALTSEPLS